MKEKNDSDTTVWKVATTWADPISFGSDNAYEMPMSAKHTNHRMARNPLTTCDVHN